MLYLTCTMISSVDLAHDGVSSAKDWVSGDSVQENLLYSKCSETVTSFVVVVFLFYIHSKQLWSCLDGQLT